MSENIAKKEQDNIKKTVSAKQHRRGFFKKFLVLVVFVLMLCPFFYYDMETIENKFSDLINFFDKKDIMVADDAVIKDRESLAQQVVENAEIYEEISKDVEKDDENILGEEDVTVIYEDENIEEESEKSFNVDDLKEVVSQLNNIDAKLARIFRDNAKQGFAFVVMQLRSQIEAGKTFEYEIAILESMLADNEDMLAEITSLIEYASVGIPTESTLVKEFRELTKPQKVATLIPDDMPWYKKIWAKVMSFVSIRKIDDNDSATSLLAAVNNAYGLIADYEFKSAVQSLVLYKKDMQPALLEWMEKAEAKINADDIINTLMRQSVLLFAAERLL